MFVSCEKEPNIPKGYTLILPAVCVGNVGQLTVDLIIHTLSMERIGYLHTDCLLPMVGNNPFSTSQDDASQLATGTEVYRSVEKNIVAVQQRAPLVRGKQSEFRRRLLEWAKQCGFSRVVLLTSSHAYERIDAQMTGTQLRYLLSPELEKSVGEVVGKLKWTQLERRRLYPGVEHREGEEQTGVFIPGGGIARKFYQECCEADFPLAVLLTFCAEGDNIPDAFSLANYLNQWLQLVPSRKSGGKGGTPQAEWKIPSSWTLLFGSTHPPDLY
ncbi:Proteasome assembly chaperone 2 [Branchiostoma belcheri]|nr:Proteasome assembly chaperone 2 [Branchiostoma belcheri]